MPSEFRKTGAPAGSKAPGSTLRPEGGNVRKSASSDLVGRMPPYNAEAEQAVLSGLLHYREQRDDLVTKVRADDFHLPAHAFIFQACLDLYTEGSPIEVESIAEKLRGKGHLEDAGGLEYLNELAAMDVLGAHAVFYAGMVCNKAMQRRLIDSCAAIMTSAYDTPYDQVGQLLGEAEQSIFAIAERNIRSEATRSIRELGEAFFDQIHALSQNPSNITGVTTGFPGLDKKTGGLQPSDLVIVAARPSMGKTAFALNLAYNAARAGRTVAFFSLEMSAEQLTSRLLAMSAKVNLTRLRQPRFLNDDEWTRLYAAMEGLKTVRLYVDDTPALRTIELRAKARRLKAREGLDLLLVDYLQLMRPSGVMQSRELEISDISRTLKALAKELDIPVVALSQLNRKLEDRTDKTPMLSDLRESGAIEQDADVVMFIHRPDVYVKHEDGQRLEDSPADIVIGKQRNGPVGTVRLLYKCVYTSFENLTVMPSPSEDEE